MILHQINKIKSFFLDLLFPKICLGCQQEKTNLCQKCLESIPLVDFWTCPICSRPSPRGQTCLPCNQRTSLSGLIYAFNYEHPLFKKTLHKVKYQLIKDLILPLTQRLIFLLQQSYFQKIFKPDLVIPIPLHYRRLASRDFNQSEIIAQILCQNFSWTINNKTLRRHKFTRSQTDLPRHQRLINVQNVFSLNSTALIQNKNIIVVDDVFTTRATLESAAHILKQGGANKIWAITLAHGKN